MTTPTKKVFIKTYGCQMNVYDSGRMTDALAPAGFAETLTLEEADLVILNTCHIRERAADKVYSAIGRLNEIKTERVAQGGNMLIAIAGCVAQAEGQEIMRRSKAVDLVFGPQSYHLLPQMLAKAEQGERSLETDFPLEDKFDHLPKARGEGIIARGVTAFLTVQEGCDKFCTFCVVPYTRGSETSRPVAKVLEEARNLVANGVRELTLLGQNVNGYHGEGPDGTDWTLGRLLFALAKIPDLARIRYTTSHPRDMHDELYAAHRDLPQVMPYLHLPIQSGSNRILAAMNRKHEVAEYLALIDRVREARPDIALSSDFIVGFPGESDEDFEATLDVIRRVGYAACYSFKYSQRPGTPAASEPDQVPEDVKAERLQRLQTLLDDGAKAFARSLVGKTLDVLFEKPGRMPGQMVGRSPYLQPVQVQGPSSLHGLVVPVRITQAGSNSLFGVLESAGEVGQDQQQGTAL